MGLWLNASGIPALMVIVFLFAVFVIFIGLTRIVVESGMAVAVASTIGSSFVISGFGAKRLGVAGLTGMALTYVWSADVRIFVMASAANGLKVIDGAGSRQRPVVLGDDVSHTGVHGVVDLDAAVAFVHTRREPTGMAGFTAAVRELHTISLLTLLMSPPDANWVGWWIQGVGGGITGLLMFLRCAILVVALSSDRLCHRSDLADGSTLVYRSSRVVNQGVYPQIRWLKRLSSSTAAVSRFYPGAVYVQRFLDLD